MGQASPTARRKRECGHSECCDKRRVTGFGSRLGGNVETGLEIPQLHHLHRYDEGEPARLSLVFQVAQVDYCLAQQSARLGPSTKLQQKVECLSQQGPLDVCPMLHI